MSRTIDFYYDLVSPYAHVVFARFGELPDDIVLRPKPVLLGAILAHHGQLGPGEFEAKRRFTYRQAVHVGERLGRPVRFPPRHPFNPLAALRLMAGANETSGASLDQVRKAFDMVFGEGRPIDEEDGLLELAARLDIAPATANEETSKEALKRNTQQSIESEVFGVPSFVPTGEAAPVFWGVDSIDMLIEWLADPDLFEQGAYGHLAGVEVGIRRRSSEAKQPAAGEGRRS